MNTEDVLQCFREAGAYLEGHFILSSGRRSSAYLQKALVFSHGAITAKLCAALGQKLVETFGKPDVIASPAVGGIIPGYETAKALGVRSIYLEREGGELTLRRGFEIKPHEKVIIVEDIVSTGLSLNETVAALKNEPGELIGSGCIIDRSGGRAELDCPFTALANLNLPDYDPDDLPEELAKIPAIKPGSRGLS